MIWGAVFLWAKEIQDERKRGPKWPNGNGRGILELRKEFWRTVMKSRGGWYDFVAGDLKDRQNPALYQPKWWAGHPVDIFFSFFRSILLRSKDSYITDRFCQQSICYNGGLFL